MDIEYLICYKNGGVYLVSYIFEVCLRSYTNLSKFWFLLLLFLRFVVRKLVEEFA